MFFYTVMDIDLIGLSSACNRKHRSDGRKANNALTFNLDHPMGARQPFYHPLRSSAQSRTQRGVVMGIFNWRTQS